MPTRNYAVYAALLHFGLETAPEKSSCSKQEKARCARGCSPVKDKKTDLAKPRVFLYLAKEPANMKILTRFALNLLTY
jgi:hypothetical protein